MPEDGRESSTGVGPAIDPARLRSSAPERRIPGRNLTKADILVLRLDGRRVALKDYSPRPYPVRALLGRFLVGRECRAYRAAAGAPGLPAFLGRVGPYALATAWVEGRTLAALRGESVPAEVFARLRAILDGLHARGVALGDLHHRDVLVGGGGEVHVVDLATAWVAGRGGGISDRIFRRLCGADEVAFARLRARYLGLDEAEALAGVDPAALAWHARGRRLKTLWDRVRGKSA